MCVCVCEGDDENYMNIERKKNTKQFIKKRINSSESNCGREEKKT